jgi:hypothetical protein
MEMIDGRYLESTQLVEDLTYQLMIMLEEGLEMGGLILFTFSLLDFIQRQDGFAISVAFPARSNAAVIGHRDSRAVLSAAVLRDELLSEDSASAPHQ